MCLILSTYQEYFKYFFNNAGLLSSTDEIRRVIRHKLGIKDSDNGKPVLLIVFFDRVPGSEHSGKVS